MLLFRNMTILLAIVAFAYGFNFGGDDKKASLWNYFKGIFGHGKKTDILPQTPGVPGQIPVTGGGVGFGGAGQPRIAPVHHHHHHHHHHYKDSFYASPSYKIPPSYVWKWRR